MAGKQLGLETERRRYGRPSSRRGQETEQIHRHPHVPPRRSWVLETQATAGALRRRAAWPWSLTCLKLSQSMNAAGGRLLAGAAAMSVLPAGGIAVVEGNSPGRPVRAWDSCLWNKSRAKKSTIREIGADAWKTQAG